ncbi:hypothetical protein CsSME_00049337 [Camellia sinensis var. sinensis]
MASTESMSETNRVDSATRHTNRWFWDWSEARPEADRECERRSRHGGDNGCRPCRAAYDSEKGGASTRIRRERTRTSRPFCTVLCETPGTLCRSSGTSGGHAGEPSRRRAGTGTPSSRVSSHVRTSSP